MPVEMLSERVGAIPGGVNIGVVRAGSGRCFMVDAGLNDTAAKKALKAIREDLGDQVVAILTTHGHADHFGGNATVVKRTGARVYAPAFDEAFLRYPLLQPACLFAGAEPPSMMRGSFMLADPSPVDVVIDSAEIEIEGVSIQVIDLSGHSPNQRGYLIDDVFFCADVILPETVLEKYKIPYLFGVEKHLAALERATSIVANKVVPGHGPLLDRIEPIRDLNLNLMHDVCDRIVDLCATPSTGEETLARLLRHYGADPKDAPAYFLLHPTIFAFLAYLQDTGRLDHEVSGGFSRWVAIGGRITMMEPSDEPAGRRTIIDLSHLIEDGMITYKGLPAPIICDFLSREASRAIYAGGTEFQIGKIELISNTGTYLDTPFHRFADGQDLSEISLHSLASLDGLMIDVTGGDQRGIDAEAFPAEGLEGKAVLIRTGWDRNWRTDAYFEDHPFLTEAAARHLVDGGVALVGIDSYNIDDTSDMRRPVHTTLLGAAIPIVEHMTGLGRLPPMGFRFTAAPPKIKGMGTFPVRAFAILD